VLTAFVSSQGAQKEKFYDSLRKDPMFKAYKTSWEVKLRELQHGMPLHLAVIRS
jgi:hypothetical protein